MDYQALRTNLEVCVKQGQIYKSDFDLYKSWVIVGLDRELRLIGDKAEFYDIPIIYYGQIDNQLKKISKLDPKVREPITECLKRWKVLGDMLIALKPVIIKGRKPTDNPKTVKRTLENTGTCGICGGNFKLKDNKLVHHGFIVRGERIGSCFGVDYLPWEQSPKAVEDYLVYLQEQLNWLSQIKSEDSRIKLEIRAYTKDIDYFIKKLETR